MREMTGGCLCGQVRYSANADPTIVAACHCKNCQKQTGTVKVASQPRSSPSVNKLMAPGRGRARHAPNQPHNASTVIWAIANITNVT